MCFWHTVHFYDIFYFLTFGLVKFILETHYTKSQQLKTNNSDYFLFTLGTDWAQPYGSLVQNLIKSGGKVMMASADLLSKNV